MKYSIALIASLTLILLLAGCTEKFDELNSDPSTFNKPTAETIPKAFAYAQYFGNYNDLGLYQITRNLFPDFWSQFFAARAADIRSDRYFVDQGLIISQWSAVYTVSWPSLKIVIEATEETDPEANAIAKIWKVWMFHSNTDFYGPIPYSHAGNGDVSVPYDSQRDVYYDFFRLLDEAIPVLVAADRSRQPFGTNDLIYHGDIDKWIKFGNTLRLRLALRISNVESDKARIEAEKAVASGVMTGTDDDAMMDVNAVNPHPLNLMSGWNYFRMSATMDSYLSGYNDPRMREYYRPADADEDFHGLRNGITAAQIADPKNDLAALSDVGPRFTPDKAAETKAFVMYASEAYFLRAEGALNGWDMNGTAQELYENGIRTSMSQWGISDEQAIEAYIEGNSLPVAPDDFMSSPPVSDIPVAFAADAETQRQQILTQKWIALYPDGIEAWAELRRTGYPEIYPVLNSDNADVPAGEMIRRIPFLDYEKEKNGEAVENAIELLSGPDKANTRLWWDVE